MRSTARWFLGTVIVLDVVAGALFLAGRLPAFAAGTNAQDEQAQAAQNEPAVPDPAEISVWTQEALNLLGNELRERAAALEKQKTEIEELLRGEEVLARAGIVDEPAAKEDADDAKDEQAANPATAAEPPAPREAFTRLQKAYENMEPDTAAMALSELAGRDKKAVVELILGWQPRTSGAILDAIAQVDPALAADLSYEIWKIDGKNGSTAAGSGRPS